MGFLDAIKKQMDGSEDKPSILPPDAPSRVNEPKAEAAPEPEKVETKAEPKKKRGRPKGAKNKKAVGAVQEVEGFAIYVDCMPVKGGAYINFEDWVSPIIADLNAKCESELGKVNFWLLPFGDQKAAIATIISEAAKGLKENLVIMSSDPYARDVLPLLVPHAAMVVRSLRG